MKRKSIILVLIVFTFVQTAYPNTYFRIIDPLNPWHELPSAITEVDLTMTPKGSFVEVGLYLTFAQSPMEIDTSVQLEAIYNFELPYNAIITDSWLWIEGKPEKALILDRWTASAIYESIVERRQDPSLLTKTGPNSYELRVYPLRSNMPRKVKINYLIPASWSSSKVTIPFPNHLFNVGWSQPGSINLYAQSDETWGIPVMVADSIYEFTPYTGEKYEANYKSEFWVGKECLIGFDSPMENGLYINKYQPDSAEDNGYYQLAVLPSALLDIHQPKKICFLVDSKGENDELAGILKNTISNYLEKTDSFNVIVSGIEVGKASPNWLPANDSSIKLAFETLGDLTNTYSILPTLIAEGIKFTGNAGAILIISNNIEINSTKQANKLIEELGEYKPWPVIHVLDLNQYNNRTWLGGIQYYGNEYFYSLLTRQTHGNYVSQRSGKSISQNLEELVQSASGFISSFDLYTTLGQGFCYSRFNSGLVGSTAYLNRPILQTGKYNGNHPFKIILSGVHNNKSFSEDFTIESDNIHNADTVAKQIWSGMYIQSLEQSSASNEIIGEIISESLENRILTLYTAFLTLEPDMVVEIPDENEVIGPDDEWAVGIEYGSASVGDFSISAFPNPFSSTLTFELELPPGDLSFHQASLKIFSVSGQLIRIIEMDEYKGEERIKITWDGKDGSGNELEQGIYMVRFVSKNMTRTLRIVKLNLSYY